jgi:predicted permease
MEGFTMIHFYSALPILALFLLGYLLKRVRYFREDTIVDIKKFVTNISLPALLFNAFLSLDIQAEYTLMIVVVYIMCLLMILVGRIVAKIAKIESPYFSLMMSGFEMGMFGYAMFISLYGEEHLGKIAFLAIGQSIFVFTFLISALTSVQNGKQSLGLIIKKFITSPIILSITLGIIVGQFKHYIYDWAFIETTFVFIRLLGSITVPLITITIGYGISIGKDGLGLSLFTIFIRKTFLFIIALIINHYIIGKFLHMDSIYEYAMLIIALSPPAFIFSVLVQSDDKENVAYINRTISLDCLISIFLMMLVAVTF